MLERNDFGNVSEAVLTEAASAADPGAYAIRVTSGTMSGQPILVVRRRVVPGRVPPFDYYAGAAAIIKCHGPFTGRLYRLAEFILDYGDQDRRMLVLDPLDLNANLEPLLRAFKPDCISGIPSFIARVLERVQDPALRQGIRVISVYGDLLTAEMETLLHAALPAARIINTYGSSELATHANNYCGYLPRSHFHPNPWVRVEIIDPDETGAGEIVLSAPQGITVDVVQYRIGDRGRFVPEACRCGQGVTFEHLGRQGGDVVKVAGAVLYREELERVMRSLPRYVVDYRLMAREELNGGRPRGTITLQVLPTPLLRQRPDAGSFLAEAFAAEFFVTPTRTLADLVREGTFSPPTVLLVESFPPQAKVVKLKKS